MLSQHCFLLLCNFDLAQRAGTGMICFVELKNPEHCRPSQRDTIPAMQTRIIDAAAMTITTGSTEAGANPSMVYLRIIAAGDRALRLTLRAPLRFVEQLAHAHSNFVTNCLL